MLSLHSSSSRNPQVRRLLYGSRVSETKSPAVPEKGSENTHAFIEIDQETGPFILPEESGVKG